MILDGKAVSAALKAKIAEIVKTLPERFGRVPHLVVILVGEDPASQVYVRNKGLAFEAAGFRSTTLVLPSDTPEEALLGRIRALDEDDGVDGILVQLPLPRHIDSAKVIRTIAVEKDVDGFHPLNVAALWQKMPCTVPCTPKGIMKLLSAAGIDPKGKRAVIIGRSNIVGLPVAKLLLDANATVTLCHTRTVNLAEETRRAEILIVAAGVPVAAAVYAKIITAANAQTLLSTTMTALRDELGTASDVDVEGTTITYTKSTDEVTSESVLSLDEGV